MGFKCSSTSAGFGVTENLTVGDGRIGHALVVLVKGNRYIGDGLSSFGIPHKNHLLHWVFFIIIIIMHFFLILSPFASVTFYYKSEDIIFHAIPNKRVPSMCISFLTS